MARSAVKEHPMLHILLFNKTSHNETCIYYDRRFKHFNVLVTCPPSSTDMKSISKAKSFVSFLVLGSVSES